MILVIIHKILAELQPFLGLVFVAVLILVSTQLLLQGCIDFIESFAEGCIIVKFRSSLILVIIRKILGKLWPFFDLVAFRDRSDHKNQCFFSFFISNGWYFKQATHSILGILVYTPSFARVNDPSLYSAVDVVWFVFSSPELCSG